MRTLVRWTVGVVVILHGLIHLLGVFKGFGWAEVSELTEPVGTGAAVAWLVATVLVVAAGVLLIARARWWWAVAAFAAVVSQAVILSSWSDAKAGTLANVLLALAALYGFAAQGPPSFRARYRRLARETSDAALASGATPRPAVTEADLGHLPAPVAGYVRASGAVGRPRVVGFRAEVSGRIRGGPDEPWMPWTGKQVNTFGPAPSRVFYMDATMRRVPADVLHVYQGASATMKVRAASLFTIIDAHGPEMDEAETVTLLNDLCVLAPAALVDAPIEWTPIDEHHARATLTNTGHTVSAELVFNDAHELIDFVSDDRFRSVSNGKAFVRQRWTTPITHYRSFDGRRIGATGRGRWHPEDEPAFDYLEFHVDNLTYLAVTTDQRS